MTIDDCQDASMQWNAMRSRHLMHANIEVGTNHMSSSRESLYEYITSTINNNNNNNNNMYIYIYISYHIIYSILYNMVI